MDIESINVFKVLCKTDARIIIANVQNFMILRTLRMILTLFLELFGEKPKLYQLYRNSENRFLILEEIIPNKYS